MVQIGQKAKERKDRAGLKGCLGHGISQLLKFQSGNMYHGLQGTMFFPFYFNRWNFKRFYFKCHVDSFHFDFHIETLIVLHINVDILLIY